MIPKLFAKNSFLKVSVSLGGFGPSVAHGKHSVRRRCVQATKNKAETCSLLDAIALMHVTSLSESYPLRNSLMGVRGFRQVVSSVSFVLKRPALLALERQI